MEINDTQSDVRPIMQPYYNSRHNSFQYIKDILVWILFISIIIILILLFGNILSTNQKYSDNNLSILIMITNYILQIIN